MTEKLKSRVEGVNTNMENKEEEMRKKKGEEQVPEWKQERLSKEQVRNPINLIAEAIEKMGGTGIIAYGEADHNGAGTLEYEIKLIEELVKRGYKIRKVFLEEQEYMMPQVEEFYKTGQMSKELVDYLEQGFIRKDSKEGHPYKLELVEVCRWLGIPVEFIDDQRIDDRDEDWEHKIEKEVGNSPDGLYFLIAGATHVSHSAEVSLHEPVVTKLDSKYPGAIISIAAATTQVVRHSPQYTMYSAFLEHLEAYRAPSRPWAIKIADTYLKDVPLRKSPQWDRYTKVKAGEAFDIVIMVPGKDLHKNW